MTENSSLRPSAFVPIEGEAITASQWHTSRAIDLEMAIAAFKVALPGWWFSMGECEVTCHASCAPTVQSPHIGLIERDDRFDSGFHADLPQPSTLAAALEDVMTQALDALAQAGTSEASEPNQ